LTGEETRLLLQEAPRRLQTEINEVLLAALARSLSRWTGEQAALVDLEGHGREEIAAELDISRTVGWFTTLFPVRLEWDDSLDLRSSLEHIKNALRRIPNHGLGWGLLRYLSAEEQVREQLKSLPAADLSFNYLGQLGLARADQELPGDAAFGVAQEASGAERCLAGRRSHLLDINGGIAAGRLELEWTYSDQVHHRTTIERLANEYLAELRSILACCRPEETATGPQAGAVQATDFEDFGWSQEDIADILGAIGNMESDSNSS
jgi:non-ribosomal peptide synthase protein (TIGR01720 family)